MTKRNISFITILAILSVITGYLLSDVSFVGRLGMNIFYEEYTFLKTWWKGTLLVFSVWLLLFGGHYFLQLKASKASSLAGNLVALMLALAGLYFTYLDFRQDFSHRLMGEPFHIGAYLFWGGWISISLFFLLTKKNKELIVSGKMP